jgi:serine/threonine protein kinase/predicted Zn-dependent protease
MSDATPLHSLPQDQRRRWQSGERVRVEAYLNEIPTLAGKSELVLDLIYNEIVLREECGEGPQFAEYEQRFPALAGEIRRLFEVHRALKEPSTFSVNTNWRALLNEATASQAASLPSVPGYEILSELGHGGMGIVYKARHVQLHRVVALKMLALALTDHPERRARFFTEARLVAQLQHPNVVQVYEVGEHEGQPFFAMEFVDGGSLAAHMAGTPQEASVAATITRTLAHALHFAHQRGILHRDLKPANVLIADCGLRIADSKKNAPEAPAVSDTQSAIRNPQSAIPKISDFGLARRQDEDSGLTRTGDVLGTPSYMAPEQAAGQGKRVGPATDVYGLGAILYEMLTGRPPFRAESQMATLLQVMHDDPVPPSQLRGKTPRDLETICLKCLHKDPPRRYHSALELAEDLARFLEGRPVRARRVSVAERLVKWARRRPAVAALLLSSVAFLLAAAVTFVWYDRHERRREAAARDEVQELLRAGEAAARQEDWADARSRAATALARVGAEPFLENYRAQADDLLAHSERRLAAQADDRRAADTARRFFARRDEALFHGMNTVAGGSLLTGMDEAVHRRAAETAAHDALALVGIKDTDTGPWTLDAVFRDTHQRDNVQTSCYTLLLLLADFAADAHDPEAALRLADRAAQVSTPTYACHIRRAHFLTALGRESEALRELKLFVETPPSSALDYFLMGIEEYRAGDLTAARTAFQAALGKQPAHFWAQCHLALCSIQTRRWDDATTALTSCLILRDDFVWVWLLRGYAHREAGRFDVADADLREAARLLEREPNDEANYVLHVNRGMLLYRREQYAEAEKELLLAKEQNPTLFAAPLDLVSVYEKLNRPQDAADNLAQALRAKPPTTLLAEYHTERARNGLKAGKYEEAVTEARKALTLQNDRVFALGVLGQALVELHRDQEAINAFDGYLQKGGERVIDVFKGRGAARARLGRYEEALSDYTEALLLHEDAELYTYRGWVYFFLDAWKAGQHDFAEALRLKPQTCDALAGRGLCRVMLGDYRAAVDDAGAAARCGPKTAEMTHNIACTYALAAATVEGDGAEPERQKLAAQYRAEAIKAVRRTLDLVPESARAAFWREKIAVDKAVDSLQTTPEFQAWRKQYAAPPR